MKPIIDYINNNNDDIYESFQDIQNVVYTEHMLLEMSNLSQQRTGLDSIIWIQTNDAQGTGKYNIPRIKFQNNTGMKIQKDELIPISISDEPEILLKSNDLSKIRFSNRQIRAIKLWIIKNRDVLMKYWNEELTTDEIIDLIRKV